MQYNAAHHLVGEAAVGCGSILQHRYAWLDCARLAIVTPSLEHPRTACNGLTAPGVQANGQSRRQPCTIGWFEKNGDKNRNMFHIL